MGKIAKYNICKAVSTLLTAGAPIITLLMSTVDIVTPAGRLSVTTVIAMVITALLMKDKLAENFKMPSAFILSIVGLVFIIVIESILVPLKAVFIVTIITSGVDEITFKSLYKRLEISFPENALAFKHAGFMFMSSKTLEELKNG